MTAQWKTYYRVLVMTVLAATPALAQGRSASARREPVRTERDWLVLLQSADKAMHATPTTAADFRAVGAALTDEFPNVRNTAAQLLSVKCVDASPCFKDAATRRYLRAQWMAARAKKLDFDVYGSVLVEKVFDQDSLGFATLAQLIAENRQRGYESIEAMPRAAWVANLPLLVRLLEDTTTDAHQRVKIWELANHLGPLLRPYLPRLRAVAVRDSVQSDNELLGPMAMDQYRLSAAFAGDRTILNDLFLVKEIAEPRARKPGLMWQVGALAPEIAIPFLDKVVDQIRAAGRRDPKCVQSLACPVEILENQWVFKAMACQGAAAAKYLPLMVANFDDRYPYAKVAASVVRGLTPLDPQQDCAMHSARWRASPA